MNGEWQSSGRMMDKRKQSNVNVARSLECAYVLDKQLRTANWPLLFLQLTSRDVIVFFALESRLHHSTCLAVVVIAITNIRQI